jgi:DNA repair exonuclease SbcCD ATPase subunit
MQLTTQNRREVIDDLLDINIFTKMGVLLKEKIARNREILTQNAYEIDLIKEKIRVQEKYITDLRSINAEQQAKEKEKIAGLEGQIKALMDENSALSATIASQQESAKEELNRLHDRRHTLHTYQTQIDTNIKNVVRDAKFYEENCECPTCAQPIDQEFKNKKVLTCKSRARELADGREKLLDEMSKLNDEMEQAAAKVTEMNKLNSRISSNNMSISALQKHIKTIEEQMAETVGVDVLQAESDLSQYVHSHSAFLEVKNKHLEEGTYNQAIAEMLKDTGIKTKVIRQYLPIMNKLINGYLGVLDFFVSFNLNENFEESIKSRHRDDFSYASFSEGEKQRIDLALLFTWRQIARMKNSVSTNLLVLDETFDSSMDTDGVENLLKILNTLEEGTNVFIISHKTDALDGKFKSKIEFEKRQNFSYIKQKTA